MSIAKDCGDIWFRLFDHQPFIQPEINTFVREFEEKRSDRELENLLDVLNTQCEIKNLCERLSQFQSSSLDLLNDKVKRCLDQSDQILKCNKAESLKNTLNLRRQERAQKWEEFKKAMEPKYIEVEAQFIREQENTRKYYEEKIKNL